MEHEVETSKSPEGRRIRRRGEAPASATPTQHPLLDLQQQAGNHAMQQRLNGGVIQAKLSISQPGDPAEQQADAMADHIMRSHAGAEAAACSCSEGEGEMCDECRQKAGLMRKSSDGGASSSPSGAGVLGAIRRSPGHPLDAGTRAFFEPRFGRDFSGVRVHTDTSAAASARSIRAHAYTAGEHLVFDTGQFAPETEAGRRLLAHELAHVAQQTDGTAATIHRQLDAKLNITMTPEYARGLSSSELASQEIAIADYLDDLDGDDPEWDAVAENLNVLRAEKNRRAKEAANGGQGGSFQYLQVQVLTPQQYAAMTGVSADQLPEGEYVSAAAVPGTAMGMMTPGLHGLPGPASSSAMSSSAPASAGPASVGPIDASSPAGRVVAFGRANMPYMDVAETNTGLMSINIQDQITLGRSLGLGRGMPPGMPYFPSGPDMEQTFLNPARPGGLDPMFSGVMTQEALEGEAAGTIHFDMRDVDLTPPLSQGQQPGFSLEDFHSSSEARQGIAYLASTGPGERNATIVIQHEEGVSVITPESNTVQGDPLPERLASRVPNINNTPEPPGGVGGVGDVGGGLEVPPATGAMGWRVGAGFIRAGGVILMVYGAFKSYERIEEATPEERPIVEAEEAGSWTGGIIGNVVGSALAGATVCAETGPGAFVCALAFGIVGGITGSVIGKSLAHDLAESLRMTPAEFANTATLMFGTMQEKQAMCQLRDIENTDPDSYDPLCNGL